jgi:hypothetical protein
MQWKLQELPVMRVQPVSWSFLMNHNPTTDSAKTISVPEAGRRYFGLSRGSSYAAAASGQIPTIRIGRILRVPVIALERMLEIAGEGASHPASPKPAEVQKLRGVAPSAS